MQLPTYEYKCNKCGYEFEEFQGMKAEPLKTCPECKGNVRRLIGTGAGIIFKGSGFYATDYRSTSYTSGQKKNEEKDTKKEAGEKTEKTEKTSTEKKKNDSSKKETSKD